MDDDPVPAEWALLERLSTGGAVAPGDLATLIRLRNRGLISLAVSLDGVTITAALTLAGEGLARLRRAVLA